MRSKLGWMTIALATFLLAACAEQQKPQTDHSEDNIVGQNLSSVSQVTGESGSDQMKVAMYDPVVCRIHQFDMTSGKWERALTPRVLGGNHKIMFDPAGNYVIDVVDASLTVFNKSGQAQDPGVQFVGAPKNASFRPALGTVVMQDDSKTAVVMKINGLGNINSVSLGQAVHDDVSMLAGDIDDSGDLIISQSDGKIAVIDIAATMASSPRQWVVKYEFASGLGTTINWLAPMHDGSHQILAKTKEDGSGNTTLAIFDTAAKAQVGSSYVVPSSRKVIKTSKLYDPHFIVRDDSWNATSTVVYVQGGQIRTKTITNPIRNVLSSRLSVSGDTWAIVDTDIYKVWDATMRQWSNGQVTFDDYNLVQQNRVFQRFALNSMTPLSKYNVPDTTQLQIGENKIFQLFPSKLGQLWVTPIANPSDAIKTDKFNFPYLGVDTCH